MAKLSTTITFKESERHLYDFLKSKRSQSGFIKDLIEAHLNGQLLANTIINQPIQQTQTSSVNKEEETKKNIELNKSQQSLMVNIFDNDEEGDK